MRSFINQYLVTQVRSVASAGGRMFRSRAGGWVLGGISFLESALPVPILTDPFLVAYILANPHRVVSAVLITTLTSVAGGVAAVVTAQYFFTLLMSLMAPEQQLELHSLTLQAADSTLIVTLFGAITPVPYTLTAWAIGIVEGSMMVFILASLFGRGLRYAVVGYAAHRFGAYALARSRLYLVVATVSLVVVTIAYVLLKM
jgi:membrane protein YqaA with SNARE-associated domain